MRTVVARRRRFYSAVLTQRGGQVTRSSTRPTRAKTLTQAANRAMGVVSHRSDMVEAGRGDSSSVRNKKRSRKRRSTAAGGPAARSAAAAGALPTQQQLEEEADRREIKEYLCRLRHLVPSCPKDGRMSRLDLIQHVIDYIVQLQETLIRHPAGHIVSSAAAAAAASTNYNSSNSATAAAATATAATGAEAVLHRSANPNSANPSSPNAVVPLANRAIPINSLLNSLRVSKWHSNTAPSAGGRERPRYQGHGPPSLVSSSNTVYKGGRYPVSNRRTTSSAVSSSASSSSSSSPTKSCRRPLGVLSSIKPTTHR